MVKRALKIDSLRELILHVLQEYRQHIDNVDYDNAVAAVCKHEQTDDCTDLVLMHEHISLYIHNSQISGITRYAHVLLMHYVSPMANSHSEWMLHEMLEPHYYKQY